MKETEQLKEQEVASLAYAVLLSLGAQSFDIDSLADFSGRKFSSLLGLLSDWQQRGWIEALEDRGPGVFRFSREPETFPWWEKVRQAVTVHDHLRMADYFGRTLPEHAERYPKVALHLREAGRFERAASMLFEAGGESLRRGEKAGAARIMENVLDLVQQSPPSEENNRLFLKAFVAATEGNPSFGQSKVLGHVLDRVLERAEGLNPEPLVVQALLYAAMGHLGMGHMSLVEPFCSAAWETAANLKDPDCIRSTTLCSGTVLHIRGRFREAIDRYESTLGDTEVLPEDPLSLAACILLAHCYALSGRISRGLGLLDAILEKARTLDYPSVALWGRGIMASIMLETGRFRRAEEEFKRLSSEQGWKDQLMAHSAWAWGMVYLRFRNGDMAGIAPYMETLFHYGQRIGNFFNPSGFEVAVALNRLSDREIEKLELRPYRDIMAERLEKSRRHPASQAIITMFEVTQGYPQYYTAEACLKRLEPLEPVLEDHGFQLALTRLKVSQASLLYDMGLRERASEKLRDCRDVIRECGSGFMPRQLNHVMGTEPAYRLVLRAVTEISQSLGTVLDRDRLIRQAIDTINRITGAERGGLFLFEGGRLKLVASRGLSSEVVNQSAFEAPMRFIEEAAESGRGAIQEWHQRTETQAPRVALAAPLILRGKIVGVIYQDNRHIRGSLQAEDVALVQAFATQMAASLENARSFTEIERLNRKLSEEKDYYQAETRMSRRSGEIVFSSEPMNRVISMAGKVAETDTAVLITGETGVGKDLIAREVHRRSLKSAKPFIRVDCASLPETLILSELFGHERGAFTGADKSRVGRFELADGGSIFLDELGELPAEAQAKFLRVLQEGEFERIGGSKTIRVDVRVIAATNRNLAREVREGRFRSDLYYRLNVFPIEIPPLRDRREDIPPLSYFFLAVSSRKLGKSFPGITQKSMKKLLSYPWPGNVRELKHIIERSAILSPTGDFGVFLPTEPEGTEGADSPEWPSLRNVERDYILRVLHQTGWKVSGPGGAAEVLGLKRSTLVSRMGKLGVEKPWGGKGPAV